MLVVVVIFVFLGRAADTLIPAVALPLSLLVTFVAMRMLDYSLDNLSLMALTLAIGFLVDDAIVFLENTVRRMERGEQALEATLNSAREISFTIFAMTISLAAVFLPLVVMPGLVGRHLPGVRRHHRGGDPRLGPGLADPHPAHVRSPPVGAGTRRAPDVDGAGDGRHRAPDPVALRPVARLVPAPARRGRGDLGRSASWARPGCS